MCGLTRSACSHCLWLQMFTQKSGKPSSGKQVSAPRTASVFLRAIALLAPTTVTMTVACGIPELMWLEANLAPPEKKSNFLFAFISRVFFQEGACSHLSAFSMCATSPVVFRGLRGSGESEVLPGIQQPGRGGRGRCRSGSARREMPRWTCLGVRTRRRQKGTSEGGAAPLQAREEGRRARRQRTQRWQWLGRKGQQG